ncbi:J domain-containing protein [Natrarchaeobius sp. A-rgal3]|uniref:J domain-containing protein n=1 Tax=Natrarchaeobius versutus TaxID=1679078 RepID=UPI00350EFFBD
MTVAGEGYAECDGCDRRESPEALVEVRMPNGDAVACCSQCVPHARHVAQKASSLDQPRNTCDGCSHVVPETELKEYALEDGTVVACCPSCSKEVPDDARDGRPTEDCGPGPEGDRSSISRCTHCHDRILIEPFRVTTVDGRVERLCRSCKRDAERRGVVSSVEMRATRARDVLGVDADASAETIRRAYRRQVKRAHPDRSTGSRSAFRLVSDAYDRLSADDH